MKSSKTECAAAVVEVVPIVIRHLRAHIRSQKNPQFTIPQFRVLAYLQLHGEATLSDLAASQGVSLPTMSKLVGSLVQRKLVARGGHGEDRRKLKLQLTAEGARAFDVVMQSTREYVADKLAHFDEAELQRLTESLRSLHAIFEKPRKAKPEG